MDMVWKQNAISRAVLHSCLMSLSNECNLNFITCVTDVASLNPISLKDKGGEVQIADFSVSSTSYIHVMWSKQL